MNGDQVTTVSLTEDGYCGWPTLLRRRSGELIAVCSGHRRGHICPYGRVLLYRSSDDGLSWSRAEVLTSGPLDDRDAGIVELDDGALVVTWFTSVAWCRALREEGLEEEEIRLWSTLLDDTERGRWRAIRARLTDEECEAALGCWAIRSEDGGRSWSEPVPTHVGNPHGPILLSDGRLLMTGSLRAEKPLGAGRNGSPFSCDIAASESRDGGRTWQVISSLPAAAGYSTAHYHEPHVVETSPGTLIMLLRNHCPASHGVLLRSISTDGGRNWSEPSLIDRWGYPAHLLHLADGRILASYSHRRDPRSILGMVSEDGGALWSESQLVHGTEATDFGYPSSVELSEDDLLTLWYEREPGEKLATLKAKHWRWK